MSVLKILFVEGDTEVFFYKLCKEKWFKSAAIKTENLDGNFNITNKILDYIDRIHELYIKRKKKFSKLRVAICIDRESRNGKAPINLDVIRHESGRFGVESIELFEAVQDIESWFFYDIENIYKFLKVPKNERQKTYLPTEKYNNSDLSKLFKKYDHKYRKGQRSENFLNNLDLETIYGQCSELQNFITFMTK